MFREGMALVEETATYLDGEGRRESHHLSRSVSLAYATESMRLTTRLMQLASWLLLQRAVNEGDLSADQANHERAKVKLGGLSTATEGAIWNELPERLKTLIDRSLRLQERVAVLETLLQEKQDRVMEAERLREVLGLREILPIKTLAAEVVARDGLPYYRVLTIDRGTIHGVRVDAPVISPTGVVGRVIRVFDRGAQVLGGRKVSRFHVARDCAAVVDEVLAAVPAR